MVLRKAALTATLFATLAVAIGCTSTGIVPLTPAVTGDGATLACASSGKNAFLTYGTATFMTMNDSIFALTNEELLVNGSAHLGSAFIEKNFEGASTFQGQLYAYWVWAYGGPATVVFDGTSFAGNFSSAAMVGIHTGMGITANEFTYFIANIVVAAETSAGVKAEDISSCFAPLVEDQSPLELSIVGH